VLAEMHLEANLRDTNWQAWLAKSQASSLYEI